MADKQNRIQKFESLFKSYYSAMMGAALRILKNERDAEDAVQQAGETLYKNIDKIAQVGGYGCYTFVIMTTERKALDMLRTRQKRKETSIDEITEKGREIDFSAHGSVTDVIKALPYEEKQAILLRYGMGYSVREVAKIMERSYSSTQSLLWRTKQKLEKIFTEKGEL